MQKKSRNENIWNMPNTLTLTRILLTFIILYFIFLDYSIILIVILFSIGMFTDFLDGLIARKFNQKTEFGRKFDMIADRFFMISVALAIIINLSLDKILQKPHFIQILMIMSREIIALPGLILAFMTGKGIPQVRWVGKSTTLMQAIVFPLIMLSVFYPFFEFSIYLVLITSILGISSGIFYINDILKMEAEKK
ncbi:CDP-alcohol phosphatidyltransferase family protein [Candidatus Pacearchaeota archaeon]|nr:CDP-alcohol phosphatidyltransferase family protein [Candidatus Pacearchaeota archaeon]